MPRARTTTEYSMYEDPKNMSEAGKKAYNEDVERRNRDIAKSRFIESEAASYEPTHSVNGGKATKKRPY